MTTAKDRRLEAGRARRQRLGQEPAERPSTAGRRYSEVDVRRAIGVKDGPVTETHAIDLYNALCCWAGLPFVVPTKGIRKSLNMAALIIGAMANLPSRAVEAAEWVVRELTPQLRPVPHSMTGQPVCFCGDELLSGEMYASWSPFGWLLGLRGLHERPEPICKEACALIVEWLNKYAALLALVAVPGTCRNPNGTVGYEWLVARSAGLRSLPGMLRWPGNTAAVWGMLGGPDSAWRGSPPMLAAAIADLAQLWRQADPRVWALAGEVGSIDRREVWARSESLLDDTRTAIGLEIRHYRSGARLSMLLGPGAGGSTAGMRAVFVTGPECRSTEHEVDAELSRRSGQPESGPLTIDDVHAAFPQPQERERGAPEGDGWIEGDSFVCSRGPGRSGLKVLMKLPQEVPLSVIKFSPNNPPEWHIQ